MSHIISKTLFLEYRYCPKNIWLKLNKRELLDKFTLSDFEKHLAEQGNEVESCARGLFSKGVEVKSNGEGACIETVQLITSGVKTLFQSTFIVDGFIARNDILHFDEQNDCWDLFEVKGTNSLKESGERDHIEDVGFQVSVLKRANVRIGKYFLIHLNKEYVRDGDLDLGLLFKIEDVTEKVNERLVDIEKQMDSAREYLNRESEPEGGCDCVYKGRGKHCSTFKHSNSHVPDYSVHDLSSIREKKVTELIENGIFELNDIPDEFELSDNQKLQISAHVRQSPIIDLGSVKDELDKLEFPLYFFDYEAFAPAIPMFNGYSPYNPIPFQFSLHILDAPNTEMRHVEFLHMERTDPSHLVAEILDKHISNKGTVIAWNKSYETRVNEQIAARLPQYNSLFSRINSSMYDLRDIFQKQYYVHHGFKGKTSIKKVLPILAPDQRYDVLDIQEGGQAADAWWRMVSPVPGDEEKAKIAKDLKIYCGLDTYAMYAIWKHLVDLMN
jgi:hypothetical protein